MVWTNSGNRFRLSRDPERGIVAGVCAGIADYLGIDPILPRIAFILALIMFLPVTLAAYIILAVVLKPRPPALFESGEEKAFWRGVAIAPDETVQALRRKFADIEERLRLMERQVTSREFDLHRKFRDLDR